jgi:predicted permease
MIERIAGIIVPVFAVIAIGYAYARWRGERVRPEAAALNAINLNLLAPLLCFTALAARDFELARHLQLLLGAAAVIAVSGLIGWGVARAAGYDASTFVPPMMFNNCGNMGLPLAVLAFGTAGLGPAVAMFLVSNLLHFSVGVRIVNHGRVPWHRSLGLLASPIMIGTLAGLAVALSGLRVPELLFGSLKLLGDACIPLMLFALGVRMLDVSFRAWRVGVIGAIVCPVAGLAGAYLAAPLLGLDEVARAQLFLFAALPPAVLNFMIAEAYQQEPEKVASITLLGNLAAVVFVPLGLTLGLR